MAPAGALPKEQAAPECFVRGKPLEAVRTQGTAKPVSSWLWFSPAHLAGLFAAAESDKIWMVCSHISKVWGHVVTGRAVRRRP